MKGILRRFLFFYSAGLERTCSNNLILSVFSLVYAVNDDYIKDSLEKYLTDVLKPNAENGSCGKLPHKCKRKSNYA